ncbi:MAG: hypothetical protein M5U26_03665 [Planctomycetota bacterium]|nr:hypothetical protein [Planctomycetota bacterium]
MRMLAAGLALLLGFQAARAGEDAAEADLRLKLEPGQQLRYAWEIHVTNDSKGSEAGKPLELRVDKDLKLNVRLQGLPPTPKGPVAASLKFEEFELQEKRKIGKAEESLLKVDRRRIYFEENGKVRIDSLSDIGLEKITDYQRNLRGIEQHDVHLAFDRTGRQAHVAGEKELVETLSGTTSQGLFPLLAGEATSPGGAWDGQFELPVLSEVKLERPARVNTKMKFAGWVNRDGRKLALLDVLSFWDGEDLAGADSKGLQVVISGVDGMGAGSCYFDPALGAYEEGNMTFQIRYKLEGRREGERTSLDVHGKTRFKFTRVQAAAEGPRPE